MSAAPPAPPKLKIGEGILPSLSRHRDLARPWHTRGLHGRIPQQN
ncbi:hypothetical protein E2C01_056453 [Portunus trituberculatus]|uniref:Uncharacterized protein n=1 Tax=Portunus trituberculatus TaxID=210409 RepID=A0A5B7GZN4_PORTR|nr:hypothetical protein [Portunus trituberculatus]